MLHLKKCYTVTPLNLGAVFLDIFNYAYGPLTQTLCEAFITFLHIGSTGPSLEVGVQLFGSTVLKSFP